MNLPNDVAHKFCREIGCSGMSPDMCKNRPFDCAIVQKAVKPEPIDGKCPERMTEE